MHRIKEVKVPEHPEMVMMWVGHHLKDILVPSQGK